MAESSNLKIFNPANEIAQRLMLAKHMPKGIFWAPCFDNSKNLGKLISGLSHEYYRMGLGVKILFDEMDINLTEQKLTDWERSCGIPDSCFNITSTTDEERRINAREKFANFQGIQTAADIERLALTFGLVVEVHAGADYFSSRVISSLTSVSTTATAVTTTEHGYIDGLEVGINNADQTEYNGTYAVSVVDENTFTYTFAGSATSPATGSITTTYGTNKIRKHTIVIAPTSASIADDFALEFPITFSTTGTALLQCILLELIPANVDLIFKPIS